jgi:type I restriction enzyme S subunit
LTYWASQPIGSLCRLVNGRAFKPSDWTEDGFPIVRIQNLNDHTRPFNRYNGSVDPKVLIDSGDILLSWSGTPGTSFGCFVWTRGPAILNQHIFRVYVDDSQIDREFFVHAVNSKLDEMIALAHGGVGLRHITKGKLEGILLPIPPIHEQRRLVTRIRECMARIDELGELRLQIQMMKSSLLSAYLNEASKSFDAESVALRDLLEQTQNGRSIRTNGDTGSGAVLTLSAVRSLSANVNARKAINFNVAIEQKYQVRKGDVFVSRSNTRELVGLSAIVDDEPPRRTIFPDLLIRLKPRRDIVRPRYLAYALRFPDARRQIQDRAAGSSQSMVKISGERLRQVRIPLPSLEIQDALIEELNEAYGVCAALQSDLARPEYGFLRAAILRKAFAGEM